MSEAAIDPGRPIVDAHHHLYDRPGIRYLADEFVSDLASGHDVRATVFVQARYGYDETASAALQPVGETRFAVAVGQRATGIAAAIVPFADLTLGAAVRPVLEAHLAAGGGRVRGIRHILAWDRDASLLNSAYPTSEAMMDEPGFRAGFAELASLGLSFDAFVLAPQLPRLAGLARADPETPIVVNHCGGPILGGDTAFAAWREGMRMLADCANVSVKLSGLGMPSVGLPQERTSRGLAALWRPWMETCIELFGPTRAMFGSNYPADRAAYAYAAGWNAMKRVAADIGATEKDKDWLFRGSATRFYRLAGDERTGE